MKDSVVIPQDVEQAIDGLTLNVNVDFIQKESLFPTIQSNHIIVRTALLERCIKALNEGKVLVIYGSLKIGKSILAEQIYRRRPNTAIYDSVPQADLEKKVKILLKEGKGGESVLVSNGALNLNISGLDDSKICQIEVPLLTFAETNDLIATYGAKKNLQMFIYAQSCGHPVLVKTLCEYLKDNHW